MVLYQLRSVYENFIAHARGTKNIQRCYCYQNRKVRIFCLLYELKGRFFKYLDPHLILMLCIIVSVGTVLNSLHFVITHHTSTP